MPKQIDIQLIPNFPREFLWGVAVSSFQVEMGKGEVADRSDWWAWVHDTENIRRGWVSGDVPEDGPGFWELYPEDLRLAKDLGCNTFRLSLDWARLFPVTTKEVNVRVERDQYGNISKINISDAAIHALGKIVNTLAVNRYRDILSKCRELGLEPMVTLYHWPIPIWLHEPIECRDDIDNASKKGWDSWRRSTPGYSFK